SGAITGGTAAPDAVTVGYTPQGAISFDAAATHSVTATGSLNGVVLSGDWNGDGRADRCVQRWWGTSTVSAELDCALSNADGTMGSTVVTFLGSDQFAMNYVAGDCNGDGKTDIIGQAFDEPSPGNGWWQVHCFLS